ncbi:hypothetical protein OCC_14030 [Thermococcus litoralis DSM 5473]|uniref:Uncharacterized protein n=1 Tax=Thermococcus litoralis (strain ATCC 51850 / DSM 5473 / JCM 8560 / NS-C) TaxID=523849 RepID=S5ZB49_THELN|nr:hypothetical protein OCC_14030 [Thermococcus litoralis DSM 5473]
MGDYAVILFENPEENCRNLRKAFYQGLTIINFPSSVTLFELMTDSTGRLGTKLTKNELFLELFGILIDK